MSEQVTNANLVSWGIKKSEIVLFLGGKGLVYGFGVTIVTLVYCIDEVTGVHGFC